ncbi:hypothetical protein ACF0H5_002737 [Mactra antiquata]
MEDRVVQDVAKIKHFRDLNTETKVVDDQKKPPSVFSALQTLQAQTSTGKTKSPVKKKLRVRGENVAKENTKTKQTKVKQQDEKTEEEFEYSWPRCVCSMNHPPVPTFQPPDGARCTYYWQIADLFPYMTLHRALTTEIKFREADVDDSGLIELEELRVLLKNVFSTETISDKMVEKTFKEIDTDGSGTLDFTEVLAIVNSLVQRQKNNLPYIIQKNYSKACVIQ